MIVLVLMLLDGGSVILKTEGVEFNLQTKYGEMRIPAGDVNSLSLGARVGDEAKFERMVRALGSDNYRERDEAMAFLKANKRGAYRFLVNRGDGDNLESKKRIEILLGTYTSPPPVEDECAFAGGAIRGKLKNEYIEGVSDSLGKVKVPLSQITRVIISDKLGKMTIGSRQWRRAGFVVSSLSISATGTVDLFPAQAGQYTATPDGYTNGNGSLFEGYPQGCLLGRINGKVFLVGSVFKADNVGPGELEIAVNGSNWQSVYSGEFDVSISDR